MVWSVDWQGDFVVGGDPQRRLTPNFRLRELHRADGSVKVHRELVSALQMLRDRFGRSIEVEEIDDDGLGAVLRSSAPDDLAQAAADLAPHGLFSTVEGRQDGVCVRIPDPSRLPAIELEEVLESAFLVTAGFETSGDAFQQVTGNFDGAGLSFGPAQVNFLTGTLQPVFSALQAADEAALRACFSQAEDYEEWLRVLALPVAEQVAWADSLSTGRDKHDVIEPWKGYLQAVGRVTAFKAIMVETILRNYGSAMLRQVEYLQGLVPEIRIDHLRSVCSLYDLVVQQGSLDKAKPEIEARVAAEQPRDQFQLVRIAVEERGKKANAAWVADTQSRRLGILNGVPTPVDGRQRANISFYRLRNVRIRGAADLTRDEMRQRVARASRAVAAGASAR